MANFSAIIDNILSDTFITTVKEYLDAHPVGVKEYDLLRHLDDKDLFDKLPVNESVSLLLFQKHFLLFHVLYSINNELVEHNEGALHVSPLSIRKLEYVEADTQVGNVDVLSEYYLDLSNLESVDEYNVNEMLNSFWEKYLRNDRREDALGVLGLSDPVTDKEIIQRYRKLATIHHPDKGGDKDMIQEINEAYAILIKG